MSEQSTPSGINGDRTDPREIARLNKVRALYVRKNTLAGAGRVLGLTRERVRQLLLRGDQLGLFTYPPPRPPIPGPEEFRQACRMGVSKASVRRKFGLHEKIIIGLGRRYGIDWADLRVQAKERRKRFYLERLRQLADRLGHTPFSSEVEADGILRKIAMYCGPLAAARRAVGLADPPPMSEAAWRGMRRRDERKRLARERRLAPLLRELAKGPARKAELARRLKIPASNLDRFLKILLADGRAERILTPTGPLFRARPRAKAPRTPRRKRA